MSLSQNPEPSIVTTQAYDEFSKQTDPLFNTRQFMPLSQALSPSSPKSWEFLVAMDNMAGLTRYRREMEQRRGRNYFPKIPPFRGMNRANDIAQQMFQIDIATIGSSPTTNTWQRSLKRVESYKKLADDIKRRGDYRTIAELSAIGLQVGLSGDLDANTFMISDVATLLMMVSTPDRFLVGTRDEPIFKKIDIPVKPNQIGTPFLLPYALSIMQDLHSVGRKELPIVPDAFIHSSILESLRIPRNRPSVADSLEAAYWQRKYILPPEGARARIQQGGNVQELLMMPDGNLVRTRIDTIYGSLVVSFDLNTAESYDYEHICRRLSGNNDRSETDYARLAADVYKDLITDKKVKPGQPRPMTVPKTGTIDRSRNSGDFFIVYIPRAVSEVNEDKAPRLPSPEPTPFTPRHVGGGTYGFPRKGNMSRDQRIKIQALQEEKKVDILGQLPPYHTWVTEFNSPKGSNPKQKHPLFIQRRLNERDAIAIQDKLDQYNQLQS